MSKKDMYFREYGFKYTKRKNLKMSIRQKLMMIAKLVISRFPRLMMICRLMRGNRFLFVEPEETPMGFKFIGNKNMEKGTFELEEIKIVEKCLEKTDFFINVGANIGYYYCIALKHKKFTIAFEPIELNLKYLYKNIKANNWDKNIEVFPVALSNRTGLIEIFGGDIGASLVKGWAGTPQEYKTLVPVSTLDNLMANRFEGRKPFILVDIEGAEDYMLEGAGKVLALDPKPIWMVEVSITEHQPEGIKINPNLLSVFQIFRKNGYEAWTADKHLKFITSEEIKEICETGDDSLLVHNFLFIEKGKKKEILDS